MSKKIIKFNCSVCGKAGEEEYGIRTKIEWAYDIRLCKEHRKEINDYISNFIETFPFCTMEKRI